MQRLPRVLVPGLMAGVIAACSGGSGAPAPDNLAEITSANAPTVASAVMTAAFEGGELGAFADPSGGAGAVFGKPASVYSKVGQIQISHTKPMLTDSQIGTFRAPIEPIQEACAVAGSIVISGDIENPGTLGVGDIITLQFTGCDNGLSVVDGTMSMTIRAFTGDFLGGSGSFEVTIDLTDFSVAQGGETQTANGDITLGMDLPNAGPITMTISSTNLSMTDGATTESLASFSLTQTIDPVTGEYSLTVSGRINSSGFEGAVDFTTSTSLAGTGSEVASTGQLVVTGDSNATITIVVLDARFLRLNVDLDGDGETDEVIDTSWDELV